MKIILQKNISQDYIDICEEMKNNYYNYSLHYKTSTKYKYLKLASEYKNILELIKENQNKTYKTHTENDDYKLFKKYIENQTLIQYNIKKLKEELKPNLLIQNQAENSNIRQFYYFIEDIYETRFNLKIQYLSH